MLNCQPLTKKSILTPFLRNIFLNHLLLRKSWSPWNGEFKETRLLIVMFKDFYKIESDDSNLSCPLDALLKSKHSMEKGNDKKSYYFS